MNIFDFFRARYLAPLSAWTRKSRNPAYKSTYSELQVQKKGLDKADPLRSKIEKFGPIIGPRLTKNQAGYYDVHQPASHPTAVAEPPLHYDPNFAQSQLVTAPKGWETNPKYSRLINFIDAETTNLGGANILSWSRLGVTYNYEKRQFEYVSSEDRFYKPKGKYSAGAWEANRLYAQDIESARAAAGYSEHYDKDEAAYLKSQLRGSIVAGHNILNADVPWLFGHLDMSTLDTLIAAENIKGRGHNELNKLFSFFHKGMKPQKIGLQEHLSQHDVLMNVFVMEKMLQQWPELLKDFSYINKNVGAQYAPRSILNGVKSNITIGNQYVFPKLTGDRAKYIATEADYYANINAGSDYTAKKEVDMYDEDGHFDGFHAVNEEERPDIIGLNENAMDAATQRWIDEVEGKILPSGGAMGAKEWAEFRGIMEALKSDISGLSDSWRNIAATRASEQRGEILRIGSRISKYSPEGRIDELRALGIADTTEFGRNILDVANRQAEWKAKADVEAEEARQQQKTERQQEQKGEADLQTLLTEGKITGNQFEYLTSSVYATNVSFKEFKRQLDNAIKTTRKYEEEQETARQNMLSAGMQIGRTPFYDPQNLIEMSKRQWKGIQGAASGFVPGVVMQPISHYGHAILNAYQSSLAGIKKWTDPMGTAVGTIGSTMMAGGAFTANPALLAGGMAVKGGAALLTQAIGQHKERVLQQKGEDLQMRLNYISASVQTLLLPFRLLTSVSLRLAKVFGGLGAALAGITVSGLKDMTQMGNPLSALSGVGYNSYYGMKAGDYAALLAPGASNAFAEELAMGSSNLFTRGRMNENTLISASLLGQFGNVYSMNPNAEENMSNIINGIYGRMKNADSITKRNLMTWSADISPTLPKILQSMDTLGVDNYEQLLDPSHRGVRWTANRGKGFMESWRRQFQWDQYEFQSIGTNIGFNKDRIAHKMWRSFGFQLYEGLNEVLEKVADGNWRGAVDTIGKGIKWLSEQLHSNSGVFQDLWKQLKELFKTLTGGSIGDTIRQLGASLKEFGIQMAEGFLRGMTPLVRLMDRLKFDPIAFMKGGKFLSFEEDKASAISYSDFARAKVNEMVPQGAFGGNNPAGYLFRRMKDLGWTPKNASQYDLDMFDLFNYLRSSHATEEERRQLDIEPEDLVDMESFKRAMTRGEGEKAWVRLTRPGKTKDDGSRERSEIGKVADDLINTSGRVIGTAATAVGKAWDSTTDIRLELKNEGKALLKARLENGKVVDIKADDGALLYVSSRGGH